MTERIGRFQSGDARPATAEELLWLPDDDGTIPRFVVKGIDGIEIPIDGARLREAILKGLKMKKHPDMPSPSPLPEDPHYPDIDPPSAATQL